MIVGPYDAGRVGVSLDGFCVWLMEKKDFPFDCGVLLQGKQPFDFKKVIPREGTPAILTKDMVEKEVGIVQKLSDGKSMEVWINTKFLKNFAKDVTFQVTGIKSGVLVYENGTLAGMIMPVNMKK